MSSLASTGISELELKRQAVLASMKNKKKNKSASGDSKESPSQSPPAVSGPPVVEDIQVINSDTLYEAVLDLRSMGYTFNQIVELSGVSRKFLANCYNIWKIHVQPAPIPPKPRVTPSPIPSTSVTAAPSPTPSYTNQYQQQGLKQRKLYTHRTYVKEAERPEWLKDLVIDLETSDEEEEEDEEDQEDEEEKESDDEDLIVVEPTAVVEAEPNNKKRTFSDSNGPQHDSALDSVKQEKKLLKEKIDTTSNKVKVITKKYSNIDQEIINKKEKITTNEAKLKLLKEKLNRLQQDIQDEEESLIKLTSEKTELTNLKDELANSLVKLEDVEKQEKDLLKMKKSKENEKETSDSTAYDETIHKIPKAQQEHFTVYKSFGFKKNQQHQSQDDDIVCPFEILNNKCDDPACKFKHLDKD